MTTLKENDIAVLNYIFDPNITGQYDINDPTDDFNNEPESYDATNLQIVKAVKLELAGIKLAEEGNFKEALDIFNEALKTAERASGYNNRAQVFRLIGEEERAMEDLEKALELSGNKGKTGCQALCQRGLIYRKMGAEEKARQDFNKAATLGSEFAKKQLVEMNPYAAMCNQMMQQIFLPRKKE